MTENQHLLDGLSIERACALLEISRSSYYRYQTPPTLPGAASAAVRLREAIERIVLAFPGYGYRRVTAQLQREGFWVNHKRVLRVMREESLLCELQRRWVKTTDSEHGLRVYPNLLPQAGWRQLTGINQAWMADLTYVRLPHGFCYLATLLDGFSRRVVGWNLAEGLDASLTVGALDQALACRQPSPGWIHHSDQGVQYACREYVQQLQAAQAQISMAAKGTPRENAQAESFFRTLKYEEVYLQDYQSVSEAKTSIGRFLEEVYNQKRLHSALGYRPPSEYEDLFLAGILH
jgi:transposase InsO family protein